MLTLVNRGRASPLTRDLLAVVSVLPIWKMKTALELPWPLRVSGDVNLTAKRLAQGLAWPP
jgi:hypothetical protein